MKKLKYHSKLTMAVTILAGLYALISLMAEMENKKMQAVEIPQISTSSLAAARVKPSSNTMIAKAQYLSQKIELKDISESTWANTPAVSFDTLCSNGKSVGPKTFVRFLWNDEKLFFHVEVEKTSAPCNTSNPQIWNGSNIEFLISPRWVAKPCLDEYEFLFNRDGNFTTLFWEDEGLDKALQWQPMELKWACVDKPKFQNKLDCWCFVGEVSFSTFNVTRPAIGDYWGLGLFRKINPVKGQEKLLAWSPTYEDPPRFHRPEKFGMLVFEDSLQDK